MGGQGYNYGNIFLQLYKCSVYVQETLACNNVYPESIISGKSLKKTCLTNFIISISANKDAWVWRQSKDNFNIRQKSLLLYTFRKGREHA